MNIWVPLRNLLIREMARYARTCSVYDTCPKLPEPLYFIYSRNQNIYFGFFVLYKRFIRNPLIHLFEQFTVSYRCLK